MLLELPVELIEYIYQFLVTTSDCDAFRSTCRKLRHLFSGRKRECLPPLITRFPLYSVISDRVLPLLSSQDWRSQEVTPELELRATTSPAPNKLLLQIEVSVRTITLTYRHRCYVLFAGKQDVRTFGHQDLKTLVRSWEIGLQGGEQGFLMLCCVPCYSLQPQAKRRNYLEWSLDVWTNETKVNTTSIETPYVDTVVFCRQNNLIVWVDDERRCFFVWQPLSPKPPQKILLSHLLNVTSVSDRITSIRRVPPADSESRSRLCLRLLTMSFTLVIWITRSHKGSIRISLMQQIEHPLLLGRRPHLVVPVAPRYTDLLMCWSGSLLQVYCSKAQRVRAQWTLSMELTNDEKFQRTILSSGWFPLRNAGSQYHLIDTRSNLITQSTKKPLIPLRCNTQTTLGLQLSSKEEPHRSLGFIGLYIWNIEEASSHPSPHIGSDPLLSVQSSSSDATVEPRALWEDSKALERVCCCWHLDERRVLLLVEDASIPDGHSIIKDIVEYPSAQNLKIFLHPGLSLALLSV